MAAKRRIRTGFATNALCVLKHEGVASPAYLAKRFGHSTAAAERMMDSLERQGLVQMSTVMTPGKYLLTNHGHSKMARSSACRGFRYDRPTQYVPMRGSRRKRR